MKRAKAISLGWFVLRIGLALLFVVTGAMKVADPHAFANALENYRLLTPTLVYGFSLAVPWIEIVCGLALFTHGWRTAAWCLAVGLGTGFSVFVISAWWRGLDISCGCFGANASRIGAMATVRALGLTLLAVCGLRSSRGE